MLSSEEVESVTVIFRQGCEHCAEAHEQLEAYREVLDPENLAAVDLVAEALARTNEPPEYLSTTYPRADRDKLRERAEGVLRHLRNHLRGSR